MSEATPFRPRGAGAALAIFLAMLAGCGGYGSGGSYNSNGMNGMPGPTNQTVSGAELSTFTQQTTIGSTLDPAERGGNPYGIAVASVTSGLMSKGDLIVCNFNDGATNSQGLGTTIIGLHPKAGATPYHIAQSAQLQGCSALASLPDGTLAATASQANLTVLVSPSGVVSTPFAGPFEEPWSVSYAAHAGTAALYVSDVANGAIDRVDLSGDAQSSFTEIATGFSSNHGVPGSIAAPAGLTYDMANDTLYVVDTNANRVVALAGVSSMGHDAVSVSGASFTGASAAAATVVASGPPLNGPISGALLSNGDLLVGNTLDPDGTNLLIEISPSLRKVIATKNVDTGAAGAIFGIVAVPITIPGSGQYPVNTLTDVVYFNDDNANAVMLLSQ